MDRKIKIGYIGWSAPQDRKAYSGTPSKMCDSLEKRGYEVKWIPVKITFLYRVFSYVNKIWASYRKRQLNFTRSIIGAIMQSKTIDTQLFNDCDVLFAPFASQVLYCIKTTKPIIYLSDATFNAMVGYYFKNLSKSSIKQGNKIEQQAEDMASVIIVSSDWAAKSVISDYHQPKGKVHVIEFGANIDDKDIIPHAFEYGGHLNLLFLGVDWQRKGGDIAVEACRYLNANGISSTLHIVGIRDLDEHIKQLPYVNYIGYLDKNVPERYAKLVNTIKSCHCLLLPTKAECAGIAFCESSANGLPVFSHDTGGVRNYVEDGRNGYLLPLGSTGIDFGEKIKKCLESGELARMSETAKDVYKEKLNWKVWARKIDAIIKTIATV